MATGGVPGRRLGRDQEVRWQDRAYPYGNVQVTITVKGKKITTLAIRLFPDTPRSYQLEAYALPRMRTGGAEGQTYKIHMVSGVTFTSEAFSASLYSAMGHAHISVSSVPGRPGARARRIRRWRRRPSVSCRPPAAASGTSST